MSEKFKEPYFECHPYDNLVDICANYLDQEDAEFLDKMDYPNERIGYIYRKLLEIGEDPVGILARHGVMINDKNNEI